MKIRNSTLRMAFFRVYREVATVEAHPVSIHEVKDAWSATGLRHSDLPLVLQDLIRCRLLHSMEPDRLATVRLNEAGMDEFHANASPLRRLEDWLTLTRIGMRRLNTASAQRRMRGRRQQDRS
jgi:hypothetical protein